MGFKRIIQITFEKVYVENCLIWLLSNFIITVKKKNLSFEILFSSFHPENFQIGFRSSSLEVFCVKGVLRNFAKLTGKTLCQRLFFNKKRLWHRCFPVNFAKFLRTTIIIEYLWWLFLWILLESYLSDIITTQSNCGSGHIYWRNS